MNSAQPLSSNCPNFQAQQQQFCAWLRNPSQQSLPPDVPAARMQVYRDLLFHNVCNFIDMVYPVAQSLIPEADWQLWQQGFFAEYHCTSPFYLDISLHFREYLLQDAANATSALHTTRYPWLHELLQYEWLELYLDTMPNPTPKSTADSAPLASSTSDSPFTQSNNSIWQLTQPIWVLVYQYPVYNWHVDTDTTQVEPSPSAVLVWRAADYALQIRPLSALHAMWMSTLQQQAEQDAASLNEQDLFDICQVQCLDLDTEIIHFAITDLKRQLQNWQLLSLS